MPDYQKMYHFLFNEITDVVERLQNAQISSEECYLSSDEPLHLIKTEEEEDTPT